MTDESFAGCLLWGQNCGSIHICCDVHTNKIYSKRFVHRSVPTDSLCFSFIFGVTHVARKRAEANILYACANAYADDFASLLKWKTSSENTTITTTTTECGWVR